VVINFTKDVLCKFENMTMQIIFLVVIFSLLFQTSSIWTDFDLLYKSSDSKFIKINTFNRGGPDLKPYAQFGCSVANIGDLDNNGYDDLVVGAKGESSFIAGRGLQGQAGAVYVLFINSSLSVDSYIRISGHVNNGPALYENNQFGYSVANIGDLDGDGIVDIAVGAPGIAVGSVYILYLERNGSVRNHVLIQGI
jgi:hypothetical protein